MKALFQPAFIVCVLAYLLVRLGRLNILDNPIFVNNYLSDFVCMPIILTLSCVGVRVIKALPNFVLNRSMIFGMTAFYAILFEFILPTQSKLYTSDPWDVVMYFSGAILFYQFQRLNWFVKVE